MKKILPLTLFIVLIAFSPAFSDIPTTPTGLSLTATSSTITVSWTANTDNATSGYYIYYYKTADTASVTRVTFPIPAVKTSTYSKILAGLSNDTQYTVQLSAFNSSGESGFVTGTMTTSTVTLDINLVSQGAVQVAVENTSADFAFYDLYIGTSSVPLDSSGNRDLTAYNVLSQIMINISSPYIKDGLSNGTYYIFVQVRDQSGTVIFKSDEVPFVVENFKTLLSDSGNVKSGCFIESAGESTHLGVWCYIPLILLCLVVLSRRFPRYAVCAFLTALFFTSLTQAEEQTSIYPNIVGLKFGYFLPAEKIQKDVYGSITPISVYYERLLGKHLSADISAGYARCKGYAVTSSSSTQTGVNATMDFIPISMSLNFNQDINPFKYPHPLITLYAGAGGDVWALNENSFYGKSNNTVTGFHGKAGVKLLTADTDFYKKFGIMIEASYSQIDRFGSNKVNLGGWLLSAGAMYFF